MVADMQGSLGRLKPVGSSETNGCFTPPARGAAHITKEVFYAVADPTASGIKTAAVVTVKSVVAVKDGTVAVVGAVGGAVGGFFNSINPFAKGEPRTENLQGSFTVVKSLYGSSLTEKDLEELLGN